MSQPSARVFREILASLAAQHAADAANCLIASEEDESSQLDGQKHVREARDAHGLWLLMGKLMDPTFDLGRVNLSPKPSTNETTVESE